MKLPLTAILQALNGLTSTVLVKTTPRISPGIGTHAPGESEMANKHIRYGNYVVHIVYTHTQGTYAHGHTQTREGNGEGVWTGASKISLLSKTLNTGCSLQVKDHTQDKCQQKIR